MEITAPEPEAAPRLETALGRRQLVKGSAGLGLGAILLGGCESSGASAPGSPAPTPTATVAPTPTPTASSTPSIGTQAERDLLNFALNILYLEAQFHSFAVTGQGLPAASLTGTGTAGAATGARAVSFSDTGLAERAREILYDSLGHITLLRELLGAEAVAQPAINLGAAGGPFDVIGQRSNFQLGSDTSFDPYASGAEYLLGSFYLIEPALSLIKRISWQMTTQVLADAVAAVCTTKAGHAGMIRLAIYRLGAGAYPDITFVADRMSEFRESLNNTGVDLDQGITAPNGAQARGMNLLPSSPAGYLPERSPAEARPIYYLAAPTIAQGGFFPGGMNGTLARP